MGAVKQYFHDEILARAEAMEEFDEACALMDKIVEVEAKEVPRFDPTTVESLKKWRPF